MTISSPLATFFSLATPWGRAERQPEAQAAATGVPTHHPAYWAPFVLLGEIRDLRGTAFMVPRGWKPNPEWSEVDSKALDTPGAVQAHADP